MAYSTADIRNIALVGQAGAGKTLLAESLLAEPARSAAAAVSSAAPPSAISIRRNSSCGIPSTRPSCTSTSARCHVNLIDTPGYPDFAGRALSVLEAVETAAIVVSAVNGIEPVTQRMMEFARDRELCRLIVINKIDSQDAQARAGAGGAARNVRPRMPAAESAGRRRPHRRRLFLHARRGEAGFLLGRGRAHRDHRPGGRGRRATDGAVPRAGRGADAGATARPFRASAARGPPDPGVLRVRRDRRRRQGAAGDVRAPDAQSDGRQSAAVPEGRRAAGRAREGRRPIPNVT